MKRIAMFLVGMALSILIAIPCFAGRMVVQNITDSGGNSSIGIGSTATVYTQSFILKSGEYFGIGYQCVSDTTTPYITLQIEESTTLPTTEGASSTNWVIPDNIADIATNLTTETQHYAPLTVVPLPYARIKITNNAATTDTIMTLKIIKVEKN